MIPLMKMPERPSHDETADLAREHFEQALGHLVTCATLLRSPDIDASPSTMRTEIAVSRAIDALMGNGFTVPKGG